MLSKAVKNQTKRLSQFRLGIVLSLGRTLALFFFPQVENELCEVTEGVRTEMEVSPLRTGTHGQGLRAHNAQAHADWGF